MLIYLNELIVLSNLIVFIFHKTLLVIFPVLLTQIRKPVILYRVSQTSFISIRLLSVSVPLKVAAGNIGQPYSSKKPVEI